MWRTLLWERLVVINIIAILGNDNEVSDDIIKTIQKDFHYVLFHFNTIETLYVETHFDIIKHLRNCYNKGYNVLIRATASQLALFHSVISTLMLDEINIVVGYTDISLMDDELKQKHSWDTFVIENLDNPTKTAYSFVEIIELLYKRVILMRQRIGSPIKIEIENNDSASKALVKIPIHDIYTILIKIIAYYWIENKRSISKGLLKDLVTCVPVHHFHIRKGLKLYRVRNYETDSEYNNVKELWYPINKTKSGRISSDSESILYLSSNIGSSFFEVYDSIKPHRKFGVLEVEVIKSFNVMYLAPLNKLYTGDISKNNIFQWYKKSVNKQADEVIKEKEELIRDLLGSIMVADANHKVFNYSFTNLIASLLLNNFENNGLCYLSTKTDMRYNSFALPASVADNYMKPIRVFEADYKIDKNNKYSSSFVMLKMGDVNEVTGDISYQTIPTEQQDWK